MKKDEVCEILLPQALLYFPQSVSFAKRINISEKQEHERSYKAAVNLEQTTQCEKVPWHMLQRVQGWQMLQSKFWQCVQRTLSQVKRNTMLLAIRILYILVMMSAKLKYQNTQFCRIKGCGGFTKAFTNFAKYIIAFIFAKFKYFAKQIIYLESPDHVLQNDI